MPSWTGTAALFLDATRIELEKAFRDEGQKPYECEDLIIQINRLSQNDKDRKKSKQELHPAPVEADYSKIALTLLDLCEELLRRLPEPDEGGSHLDHARAAFARNFRYGAKENAGMRLSELLDPVPDLPEGTENPQDIDPDSMDPLLDAMSNLICAASCPNNLGNKLKEQVSSLLASGPNERCATRIELNRDPVDSIFRTLGVSRVLTLNFDLELERWVKANRKVPSAGNGRDFDDLCMGKDDSDSRRERPASARIEVKNGVSRTALSVSLNQSNVGDLINFGSYPHAYDHQIFHLHGRADLPKDVVASLADYNRVYVQDELSQQAFEAAREVVFAGNDVLFIGVGMEEEDVLRPFRRFVSRERRAGQSPRRTFALMPSATGTGWREENDRRAVSNAIRYDVFTLFYGGEHYRELREKIATITRLGKKPTKPDLENAAKQCTEAKSLDEKRDKPTLLSEPERALLSEPERALLEKCGELIESIDVATGDENNLHYRLLRFVGGELESRIISRSLVKELEDLGQGAQKWWKSWRDAPHERKAIFHRVIEEETVRQPNGSGSNKTHRLWTRHRNDLGADKISLDSATEVLCELNKASRSVVKHWIIEERKKQPNPPENPKIEEAEVDNVLKKTNQGENKGRRIARITADRGGGKGTVIGLMHRGEFRQRVFACDGAPAESAEPEYTASFLAHMSFSMEFNSVVKSLTRFLARQIAEALRKGNGDEFKSAVKAIKDELKDPAEGYARLRRLRELARLRGLVDEEMKDAIGKLVDWTVKGGGNPTENGQIKQTDLDHLAKELFVQRCEDEPALLQTLADEKTLDQILNQGDKRYWSKQKLGKETPREHRLDQLCKMLRLLQKHADGKRRYFVCLGGLEKLADENGDAFNPAHREFFRLITGHGKNQDENPPNPPIDFVFFAGRPESPICYLSEDLGPPNTERDQGSDLLLGDREQFTDRSKTGRLVRKWFNLSPLSWRIRREILNNRLETTLQDEELTKAQNRLEEIYECLAAIDSSTLSRPVDETEGWERVHRLLWLNVSLSNWVMSLWALEGRKSDIGFLKDLDAFLAALDGAAAMESATGILDFVLGAYEIIDRKDIIGKVEAPFDDVIRHILRHLTLFALPVEPWVLLGCPMIYERLKTHYRAALDKPQAIPDSLDLKESKGRAWLDWFERAWMMRKLEEIMGLLTRRGLVLGIEAAADVGSEPATSAKDGFLHQRFALHGLMREHLARKMHLSVMDGADLNYHRMSVYCDQPRDLPTPTADHFHMIDGILNNSIRRCRETLWMLAHIGPIAAHNHNRSWDPKNPEPDELKKPAALAAGRRLFSPDVDRAADNGLAELATGFENIWTAGTDWHDPCGPAGGLGRLHAVPQRLRACLSLLQSTFSIGTLSRSDGSGFGKGDGTPYDAYRNWLRSLTNAATSLGQSRHAVKNIFEELSFPDGPPSEFAKKTKIAEGKKKWFEDREIEVGKTQNDLGFKARQSTSMKHLRHPFFRDEIAWLYNERGLTCLAQGRVQEALPLFEQASFIMSHRRTPNSDKHAFHAAERRIRLNHGIALVERGELVQARGMFHELERSSAHVPGSTPSHTKALARLYSALCDHLTGGHQAAKTVYNEVIHSFVDNRQHRPAAIANRHLADLLASQELYDEALGQVDLAIASASQAQQRDIFYLATISKARILIRANKTDGVLPLIDRAVEYALSMGQESLLIDAKLALSLLQFSRGELSQAGQVAAEALAKAVRSGLQLRQVSALVALAEIKARQRHVDLARSILIEAKSLAETLNYLTQVARATRILSELESNR